MKDLYSPFNACSLRDECRETRRRLDALGGTADVDEIVTRAKADAENQAAMDIAAMAEDLERERCAKLVEAEREARWPDGVPYYARAHHDRLTRLAEQIRSGDDG